MKNRSVKRSDRLYTNTQVNQPLWVIILLWKLSLLVQLWPTCCSCVYTVFPCSEGLLVTLVLSLLVLRPNKVVAHSAKLLVCLKPVWLPDNSCLATGLARLATTLSGYKSYCLTTRVSFPVRPIFIDTVAFRDDNWWSKIKVMLLWSIVFLYGHYVIQYNKKCISPNL